MVLDTQKSLHPPLLKLCHPLDVSDMSVTALGAILDSDDQLNELLQISLQDADVLNGANRRLPNVAVPFRSAELPAISRQLSVYWCLACRRAALCRRITV
jgi:hypothetical protein